MDDCITIELDRGDGRLPLHILAAVRRERILIAPLGSPPPPGPQWIDLGPLPGSVEVPVSADVVENHYPIDASFTKWVFDLLGWTRSEEPR